MRADDKARLLADLRARLKHSLARRDIYGQLAKSYHAGYLTALRDVIKAVKTGGRK